MANSIYLGGGIKSAFCGGNVKEIWQGTNKLWGGGEPLPQGFERVDYIEHTSGSVLRFYSGSAWFNDLVENDTFEYGMTYKCNAPYDLRAFRMFALSGSSKTWSSGISASLKSGFGVLYSFSSKTGGVQYNLKTQYDGSPLDIKVVRKQNLVDDVYVDGVKFTANKAGYMYTGTGFTTLFSCEWEMVGTCVKYFKLYNNDGSVLKHNFVPARRKSDNAPAIIDTVTQEYKIGNASAFRAVKL